MIQQFVFLALLCTTMADDVTTNPNTAKAVEANNQFSLDLLKKLFAGNANNNVFFSPYSISAALAMTSLGAGGKTLTEIDSAMHFDNVNTDNRLAIHEVYKALISLYNQENSNYSLSTANRLFGQNNFAIKEQFQNEVKEYYFGELQQLDFSAGTAEGIINKWVEDQTHDKIKDLFKPGSLTSDVVLVLVNAIYFKGNWNTQFKKSDTREGDFHTSANTKTSVQMMHMTKRLGYYYDSDLKAKVLEMPYVGKDLSMFVVLPDEIEGLSEIVTKLTAAKLHDLFKSVSEQNVEVKFPKFKLETEYSLVDTLKTLGINDLFSSRCNLSSIAEMDLGVSEVIHKAFVNCDEEGSEAAGSSGVVIYLRSGFEPVDHEIPFIADHPFIFVIRDTVADMNLFTGILSAPVVYTE